MLVGYGPRTTTAARRPRKGATPPAPSAATAQQAVQTSMMTDAGPGAGADGRRGRVRRRRTTVAAVPSGAGARVLAKPPVRKLAKDLGVDLADGGTRPAPDGVVTRDDVEAAAAAGAEPRRPRRPGVRAAAAAAERETRVPVKGVRKVTAQAMVASAFTAPHVTELVRST